MAALVLNALAVGSFAEVVSGWHDPAGGATSIHRITAVELAPRRDARVVEADAGAPVAAPPRPSAPVEPASNETRSSAANPTPALPGPTETGTPLRFYRSSEVDRPAEPDNDWNLDTATLDALGVERLVFDMFIDREGIVVACSIVEPADLADDIRLVLETRLKETAVTPALRHGDAVASMRRIEIVVLPALR